MSNLGDLLTLAINMVFVFATVSFVASAGTDGIAQALQWRERLLLRGVKGLLDDPLFTGLARSIYNNARVNPRASGSAATEAQLSHRPAAIAPADFGNALLEVLHVVPTTLPQGDGDPADAQPGTVYADVGDALPIETRMANAIANATRVITRDVAEPRGRSELVKAVTALVLRHRGDRAAMEASAAAWYEAGVAGVTDQFRKRAQLTNFALGLLIAVLLNLKPIPVGGFAALTVPQPEPPAAGEAFRAFPIIVNLFEYLIVAASTLFGAQFWFAILKWVVAASTPRPPAPPPPAPPGAQPA